MQSDMNAGGENQNEFVNNMCCLKKACNCLAICNSNIFEIVGSIEIRRQLLRLLLSPFLNIGVTRDLFKVIRKNTMVNTLVDDKSKRN